MVKHLTLSDTVSKTNSKTEGALSDLAKGKGFNLQGTRMKNTVLQAAESGIFHPVGKGELPSVS